MASKTVLSSAPSGARTLDTLIKSQGALPTELKAHLFFFRLGHECHSLNARVNCITCFRKMQALFFDFYTFFGFPQKF